MNPGRRARAPRDVAMVAALLLAIGGCSGGGVGAPTALPDTALPECPMNVSLSVGPGTQPVFTWTPACRAFVLLVEGRDGEDMWGIQASAQRIVPSVRYGAVPAGATEMVPPNSLATGVTYHVVLLNGTSERDATVIALVNFTP